MKRLSFLCALALSGLLACSCTEDAERTDASGHASGTPVNRSIEVATLPIEHVVTSPSTRGGASADEMVTLDYGVVTRAASSSDKTDAESKIHSLYILQFEGTAEGSKLLKKSEDLSAKLAAGNGKVDFEFAANGAANRVYVVANMDVSGYTVNITTLKAFEEGVVAFTPATEVPASGLPMAAAQDFNPMMDAPGTFSLKTPLAKLTFGCDFLADVTTTGDLQIQLKNLPSGYFVKAATLAAANEGQQPASDVTYTGTLDLLASKTSAVTCYFPANLAGRNTKLENVTHRNFFYAPANATYVEITGTIKGQAGSRFYLALGDGTAQDFNVASNSAYAVTATIKGVNEAFDLRVGSDITDLNAQLDNKTANCYIVTESNKRFAIDATVMGNGATTPAHTASSVSGDANFPAITPSALDPHSAAVLWQTNNTATYKGAVVGAVMAAGGKLIFRTTDNEGNAVVAAYGSNDGTGDVIWSWHIWRMNSNPAGQPLKAITATDATVVAANGELVAMDRNLGALSATYRDDLSAGLLYQWGRKDPFPGAASIASLTGAIATSPSGIPAAVSGGSSITPADAVKNPVTFYRGTADWTSRNDNLWGTPMTGTVVINNGEQSFTFNSNKGSKSIYDPCPVGWRVPPAYAFATIAKRNLSLNRGYLFPVTASLNDGQLWLPAVGFREASGSSLRNVGNEGSYWTSSSYLGDSNGHRVFINRTNVSPAHYNGRALGFAVRCVKE